MFMRTPTAVISRCPHGRPPTSQSRHFGRSPMADSCSMALWYSSASNG